MFGWIKRFGHEGIESVEVGENVAGQVLIQIVPAVPPLHQPKPSPWIQPAIQTRRNRRCTVRRLVNRCCEVRQAFSVRFLILAGQHYIVLTSWVRSHQFSIICSRGIHAEKGDWDD
jgi:hypothetical protein